MKKNQYPHYFREKFLKKLIFLASFLIIPFTLNPSTLKHLFAKDLNDSKTSLIEKVIKTKQEWKRILSPEQFYVMREKGTEHPFSHPYNKLKQEGDYHCVGCDLKLFSSKHKFDSGTGWPSFWQPYKNQHISKKKDTNLFMKRIEVLCNRCDSHLGHVFDDGPKPTGLRYCINAVSLKFKTKK